MSATFWVKDKWDYVIWTVLFKIDLFYSFTNQKKEEEFFALNVASFRHQGPGLVAVHPLSIETGTGTLYTYSRY